MSARQMVQLECMSVTVRAQLLNTEEMMGVWRRAWSLAVQYVLILSPLIYSVESRLLDQLTVSQYVKYLYVTCIVLLQVRLVLSDHQLSRRTRSGVSQLLQLLLVMFVYIIQSAIHVFSHASHSNQCSLFPLHISSNLHTYSHRFSVLLK